MPAILSDNNKEIVPNWRKNSKSIKKFSFIYAFLPHPEEKRRAHLLSSKALFIYTFILALFLGIFKFIPEVAPGVLGYASDIHVKELLHHTNEIREEAGLEPLKLNNNLSRAAYSKAKDMFEDDYWAHVAPDGTQPWDFILGAGYDYVYAGENLAKNFNGSKEVVEAWYASESHRENLLNPNYEEIGFAVVDGILDGYETTLVVQTFGKQRVPTYLGSASVEPVEEKPVELIEERAPATTVNLPAPLPRETLVLPAIDVTSASRLINISFGLFLGLLLILDIWYSKKKGTRKISGHTFAHLLFLLFAFVGMWFALSPGKIL